MDWLDDLHEGVVLFEEGVVTYVNAAAADILHVDAEWALGRPLIAVARDHRIEAVAHSGSATELDVRGRRLHVEPIRGGLSLQDVTRIHRRDQEARELLAVLSHELRTPVTTIQSALEALQDDDLPGSLRDRFLQRAEQEVQRLRRLLADLTVDVSPPRARSVLVPDVLDRAEALLAPLMEDRSVEVVRAGPPLTVWMDPDKMLQIVLNLLENAIIHGPRGEAVLLDVRTSSGGERVELEVVDRGEPLPADGFDAMFVPHRRGEAAAAPGAGLGLYIVRSIAERSGGRAWGRPTDDGNAFGVAVPAAGQTQAPAFSAASDES